MKYWLKTVASVLAIVGIVLSLAVLVMPAVENAGWLR